MPPGGHRLAGPPNLPGGVLKTPASYLGATWEVHVTDFWEAPGDPQALLAWEQGHLTPRFTLGDAGFGPPVWDRGFELAPEGAMVTRELDVEVASAGDGQDRYPGGRVGGLAAAPAGRQPDPVRGADGHHRRASGGGPRPGRPGRPSRQAPARPGHDHRPGHGARARGAHRRPPAVHDPARRSLSV